MRFRWMAAGKLKPSDLLYWLAYTWFDGDVMLRDATDAVARVRLLGDGRVCVDTIDKSASGLVLTFTGEYEADEFVPVVDEEMVRAWIEEAVEELTRL